jgi:hypothetical protein
MASEILGFPRQKMPTTKKGKDWRKAHLDWADRNSYLFNTGIRRSLRGKKINYDLYNGILHEEDMKKTLNPLNKRVGLIPRDIQHYPIINNPINTLVGEESRRKHDYNVKVCNEDAVSEIERSKIKDATNKIMEIITNNALSEEDAKAQVEELQQYYNYKWQDIRELRANWLLKHYIKELDFDRKMNQGFKDVLLVSEEIYQFDITSGEPTFEVLNPRKVYTIRSSYSSKMEDSDIIIIDDYWAPSKILDVYYDSLKDKDVEYIETLSNANLVQTDDMGNIDERNSFLFSPLITEDVAENSVDTFVWMGNNFSGLPNGSYVDNVGNIRVLRIYWKSKRKIKKVKSFDPQTGEEIESFKDETYLINPMLGEESTDLWINEVWEGTKIGKEVYINMRPKPIQYLRLSNPSQCHAGIIGQIYNTNQSKPSSILDRMKPYQYLYDAVKDRLNKTIAKNYGKILELDKARMPSGWDYQKWLYFIEQDNISVVDSFKEGNKGAATGKIAGNFNTSGRPLDLEVGNSIQMYINLLEYLKNEMFEISGVSKQRQGQVDNRETVGGVERAVSGSSHITEELFSIHDNVRKRCLTALLETAKIALKGRSKKAQYITDDKIMAMLDIDGDEFAEMDYDVIVDNDMGDMELKQKLEQLAHAGLQNQLLSFSTIMKIFTDPSLTSIMRRIEQDEQKMEQRKSEEMQAQQEQVQAQIQSNEQLEQLKMQLDDLKNQRDNETKIQVALIGQQGNEEVEAPEEPEDNTLELEKLSLSRKKLEQDFNLKMKDLDEKIRHNQATETIARNKPKPTSK